MHFKTLVALLLAVTATAAPHRFGGWDRVARPWQDGSNWLHDLVAKFFGSQDFQAPPQCDMASMQMPSNGDLPGPDSGLVLHHIALGRGTQNYTCDTKNPTSAPVAAGAVATLFNVTCLTSKWPLLVEAAPSLAVHLTLDAIQGLNSWGLLASGHHYFINPTTPTPYFDLNTSQGQYGTAPCAKNHATNAPANAAAGLSGEGAVPWLKLTTLDGATQGMKNVFRTSTAGGSPPATCEGQQPTFQVQYSALYWFYSTL